MLSLTVASVLKAIVTLKKHGVFASALIKKHWYWPTLVPRNAMQSMLDGEDKRVGDFLGISGSFDGEDYFLWGMKEPDYAMKMMATGGMVSASSPQFTTTNLQISEPNGIIFSKDATRHHS